MSEGKKYTDEEIVKALKCIEGQYISYIDNDDDKCKLLFVDDILDLIHRLQDENEQLKCNSYTTSWKGKFFEAKKEIDNMQDVIFALEEEKRLLKKEIETQRKVIEYQDGLPDLVEQQKAAIERLTEENGWLSKECNKTTAECVELQKQVDELTAFKNEAISMSLYGKGRKDGEEIGRTQTVKDTAKEILDEVSKHFGGRWLVELYKKYGLDWSVEVE